MAPQATVTAVAKVNPATPSTQGASPAAKPQAQAPAPPAFDENKLSERGKLLLNLTRTLRKKTNTVDSARSQVPKDNLNQGAVLELCFANLISQDEGLVFVGIGPDKSSGGEGSFELGDKLYCRVSPKGALSVYGLQRMPVTLYSQQWERLLNVQGKVREALKVLDDKLQKKVPKEDKA